MSEFLERSIRETISADLVLARHGLMDANPTARRCADRLDDLARRLLRVLNLCGEWDRIYDETGCLASYVAELRARIERE